MSSGLKSFQTKKSSNKRGIQLVNDKIDKMDQRIERVEHKLDSHIEQNRQEHQLYKDRTYLLLLP